MIKRIQFQHLYYLSVLGLILGLSASVNAESTKTNLEKITSPKEQTQDMSDTAKPKVKLTTSFGEIVLELDPTMAPKTVENFLRYVNEGFYDGTIFHRVIPGFMIQGGGFTPDMDQKDTHEPIVNEARSDFPNQRGTIAMARTSVPDSATAQFFINLVSNDFLNFKNKSPQGIGYAVFGEVIEGIAIVDKIADVRTGSRGMMQDVPVKTVVIEKAVQIKE